VGNISSAAERGYSGKNKDEKGERRKKIYF